MRQFHPESLLGQQSGEQHFFQLDSGPDVNLAFKAYHRDHRTPIEGYWHISLPLCSALQPSALATALETQFPRSGCPNPFFGKTGPFLDLPE